LIAILEIAAILEKKVLIYVSKKHFYVEIHRKFEKKISLYLNRNDRHFEKAKFCSKDDVKTFSKSIYVG
jgi:hypothetical protein